MENMTEKEPKKPKPLGVTTRVDTVALDALLSIAESIAYNKYNGKLVIVRTNEAWFSWFGSPKDTTGEMSNGASLEEALTASIVSELANGKIDALGEV